LGTFGEILVLQKEGGISMTEHFNDEELKPDVDDDSLDDSVSDLLGEDIPEVELPDYDPDAEFEGDENADY
jgi:hypothetical protein